MEEEKDKKTSALNDTPATRAHDVRIRKASGIKTQEDVKEEIEAAYALFIYLCKTDYIFYLRVNHLFDELFTYLNELTPNKKTGGTQKATKPLKPREFTTTVYKTLESSDELRKIHQLLDELNRKIIEDDSKLDQWLYTARQLREVKFEHYFAVRDNRHEAHVALFNVLEQAVNDQAVKGQPHYEALVRVYEQEKVNLAHMRHEVATNYINPDGSQNLKAMQESAEDVSRRYESAKNNILSLLQKPGLGVYKKQADDVITQADEKLEAINIKYNTMIEALELKLQKLCIDSKVEQKSIISNLSQLIQQIQKTNEPNLNSHERDAFDRFVHSIDKHSESIDNVTTPEALQGILGSVAHDLNQFIDVVKDNPNLTTILPKLKEVQGLLATKAQQALVAHEPASPAEEHKVKLAAPTAHVDIGIKASAADTGSLKNDAPLQAHSATYKEQLSQLRPKVIPKAHIADNPLSALLSQVEDSFTQAKEAMDEVELSEDEEDLTEIDELIQQVKTDLAASKEVPHKNIEKLKNKIGCLGTAYSENNYFREADLLLEQITAKLEEPDSLTPQTP